MNEEKYLALIDQYFDAYPVEDTIHITSDGQVFLQANYSDAVNHQRKLDEKTQVLSVSRKEWESVKRGESPDAGDHDDEGSGDSDNDDLGGPEAGIEPESPGAGETDQAGEAPKGSKKKNRK